MNAIGAISSISGVSGVSGVSGISGAFGASSPSPGREPLNGAGAVDGSPSADSGAGQLVPQLAERRLRQLNGQLTAADSSMASFAAGEHRRHLHTVMLQMEEASVSLKTATDVRDKLLEAYQDIMRTQI